MQSSLPDISPVGPGHTQEPEDGLQVHARVCQPDILEELENQIHLGEATERQVSAT
jgi:hypothetical protein